MKYLNNVWLLTTSARQKTWPIITANHRHKITIETRDRLDEGDGHDIETWIKRWSNIKDIW